MSSPTCLKRAGRAGIALAVCLAFVVVPVAAQAAPVNLATASPFVVLGGSTVTNTGPSVLNGQPRGRSWDGARRLWAPRRGQRSHA